MKYFITIFFKNSVLIVLSLIFLTLTGTAQNSDADIHPIHEYTVNFVSDTIRMDGLLGEAAWDKAAFTKSFLINNDGTKPRFLTRAQMLWDNINLYIAFTIEDNDIWSVKRNHDEKLWQDEAVEVFIDPDGDGFNYLEVEVNSLGTVFDLYYKDYNSGKGRAYTNWDIQGLKVGIKIDGSLNDDKDDNKWICEMAIPFKPMTFLAKSIHVPPKEGDVWRLNLYRIERNRKNKTNTEYTSWNPTYTPSFHIPERFGKIVFVKNKL